MNKKSPPNKRKHAQKSNRKTPPPHQIYERGKRIWLGIVRDLPTSFERCSLVPGSLLVKKNSYHVSLLKQLLFSLWNLEIQHRYQILSLEVVPISAIRYSWYLMEVFKMLSQNNQKLCFNFRPGDLYNALKILSLKLILLLK